MILARLGFRSGWISKLVDNPLGRRIVGEVRRHGVDVSAVVWSSQGRTGLYFIEHVPLPRGVAVHYDRTGSACSTMTPEDVDWVYVRSARWVHVTGITPALSASCARTSARLLDEARACGVKISFDVNYRRKLWTAQQARAVLEPLLDGVELVIATQEDAHEVFGLAGTPPDLAARLRDHVHAASAVITAGAGGAYLADGQTVHHEPAVPGTEVDPIGRGDAFAAGLLWAALEADLAVGLRYGVVLASLAQAYRGDIPWVTRQDVLRTLAGRGTKPAR